MFIFSYIFIFTVCMCLLRLTCLVCRSRQGGALGSDAVLESVMIIRLATGAMVEVVVPFGFSKAGFLSGCPVELGSKYLQ